MKRVLSTGDITSAGLEGNDNDGAYIKVRGGRKRSKKITACSQPVQKINTAATTGNESTGPVAVSEMSQLQKSVEQLSTVVRNQQATINSLVDKLKFVLSFLDIADNEPDSVDTGMAVTTNNTTNADNTTLSVEAAADAATPETMSDTTIVSQQSSQPPSQSNDGETVTYASVATSNRRNGGSGQPSNLREAVAAAVYEDQRAKERRAKSVIVSGLMPSRDNSDTVHFQRLCMLEFGINPAIVYARRLGSTDGDRVRPLLIGLQSADDASSLMDNAKKLRRSTDDIVRNNVYINKNLSKLEARTAYEERCRRRRRQQGTDQTSSARHHDSQQPSQPSRRSADATVIATPSAQTTISTTATTAGRHR